MLLAFTGVGEPLYLPARLYSCPVCFLHPAQQNGAGICLDHPQTPPLQLEMCTALAPAPLHTALRYRQTDTQTDRRGQAAAIPASPAQNNSRRLDSDQVFPQALFDMNIKGASQIPSTVRGLENPCCRASRPSSPMRRAKPTPSTAPGTPAPLPFPEGHSIPCSTPGTTWHRRMLEAASSSGRLPATPTSPSLLPLGLGSRMGLEAAVGAGRGFHMAAWAGGSAAGCVTPPHPGSPGKPFGRCQLNRSQPGAAPAFPFPAPWAEAPAQPHQSQLPSSPLRPAGPLSSHLRVPPQLGASIQGPKSTGQAGTGEHPP